MTLKVVRHPDRTMIREIFPSGERAYRCWKDGGWDYSPDHKDFWVAMPEQDVPLRFKAAMAVVDHVEEDKAAQAMDNGRNTGGGG